MIFNKFRFHLIMSTALKSIITVISNMIFIYPHDLNLCNNTSRLNKFKILEQFIKIINLKDNNITNLKGNKLINSNSNNTSKKVYQTQKSLKLIKLLLKKIKSYPLTTYSAQFV